PYPTVLNGGLVVDFSGAWDYQPADIWLSDMTVKGGLGVFTGAGNDLVRIDGSSIGRLGVTVTIRMGGGNDTLDLGSAGSAPPVFYSNSVTFDGGAGINTLNGLSMSEFPNYKASAKPNILNFLSWRL